MNKQLKKYLAVFITASFLLTQNFAVSVAFAAPDLPDAPDNSQEEQTEETSTPEPTVAPTPKPTPKQPDAPDNAPAEEDETPKPSATPEPSATPKPTSSPEPEYTTAEDMQTQKAPKVDTNSGDSNSGDNTQDGQVGGTTIDTGNATGQGSILNTGNTNIASKDATTGAGSGDISIVSEGNGTNSDNSGAVSIEDNDITVQDNNANINNELEVDVNSGNNSASKNVGGTNEIDTGSATAVGTIINSVNTNIAGAMVSEFNVDDNQIGDLILDYEANCVQGCGDINLANKNNGSNSTNNTQLDLENNTATFQNNDAQVENDLILAANTGNNHADSNTNGNNIIDTGDANVAGNVINMLNNNIAGNVIYGVVNVIDDFVGNIIVPEKYASAYTSRDIDMANIGNGSNSTNSGDVIVVDSESFDQYNEADIVNNLVIDANTGGNNVSKNTSGNNEVDTGNVNVDASILNIANNNVIGGDWWIVLVNEAGNWVGKIFAPEGSLNGGNFAAAGGTATQNKDQGSITLSNNGNGSESTNTGSIDQTNNSETVQSNKAAITNNINLSANTGNNSASKNTGGSNQIDTGNANVQFNLVNFLNNNFAGGNVFLTVVNVFGSWTGDFVTPNSGHKSEDKEDDKAIGGSSDIANNSSSNNNSNNNSSNNSDESSSNNNDNTSNQAVLAAQSKADNDPYGWGTGGSIQPQGSLLAEADSDEQNPFELVEEAKAATGEESANSKTRINLAWALLLLPAYIVVRIVRSRFLS